jgi:hypothetical protein
LGISAILLIFPKFLRTRKLLWIVVAIENGPLSVNRTAEKRLADLAAGSITRRPFRAVSPDHWTGRQFLTAKRPRVKEPGES